MIKKPLANAGNIGDAGLILGLERSPEGGHGNPLQYSCLENPMDRGAWQAMLHRVTKSGTWLKRQRAALIVHTVKRCHRGVYVAQVTCSLFLGNSAKLISQPALQ